MFSNFKPRMAFLVALTVVTFATTLAHAISLEFVPATQTVGLGQEAAVDVFVTQPGSTKVGAFDFNVNFDPSILSFNDLIFGSSLGPFIGGFATDGISGTVGVNAVSQELDLTPFQSGQNLLLFTMLFDTDGMGTSPLSFTGNIGGNPTSFLVDDSGVNVIPLDTIGTGSITVVPEPGTMLLLGVGLIGLVPFRKKLTRTNPARN